MHDAQQAVVQTKWMGIWGEWDAENGLRFLGKGRSLPVDFDGLVIGVAASNIERFTEGEVKRRSVLRM